MKTCPLCGYIYGDNPAEACPNCPVFLPSGTKPGPKCERCGNLLLAFEQRGTVCNACLAPALRESITSDPALPARALGKHVRRVTRDERDALAAKADVEAQLAKLAPIAVDRDCPGRAVRWAIQVTRTDGSTAWLAYGATAHRAWIAAAEKVREHGAAEILRIAGCTLHTGRD